jgi:hypothetical protein
VGITERKLSLISGESSATGFGNDMSGKRVSSVNYGVPNASGVATMRLVATARLRVWLAKPQLECL